MEPSPLIIRPAQAGDAAAILQVHRAAILAKAAGHYPAETLEAWAVGVTAERLAHQERQIADPAFIVLVAQAAEETIGFAIAVPGRNELRSLYVKPNGAGAVGRELLRELERRAFGLAEFLVCDASLNAVGFYRSHGYLELEATEHVLSSGARIPCVRMKKTRP